MVAMFVSGCGHRPPETPQSVGFIDYAKLYMNHPLAAEARELEAKIGMIGAKASGFSVASLPPGINTAQATGQMLEVFFRQEIAAKMQETASDFDNKKRQAEQALRDYVETDLSKRIDVDSAKAMELTTEMTALQLDATKKASLKQQIDTLFAEDDAQKNMLFNAKKQAARMDLNDYSRKLSGEMNIFAAGLRSSVRNGYAGLLAVNTPPFDEKPLLAMKELPMQQIEKMRKRMEEIKRLVDSDIRKKVAIVAKQHELGAVISVPLVNVKLIDVTDDVMEKLIHGE